MNSMNIPEKLQRLRLQMQKEATDALIIMSADPHMSEYLPDHWKIRQWITGFTGSVGTIVITQDFAGLWVDGRYWVQAEQQLAGTGFVLQKLSHAPETTHLAWLKQHLAPQSCIAVDGQSISIQAYQALKQLAEQYQFNLNLDSTAIASIWTDRPALPVAPIRSMSSELNDLSVQDKIAKVRLALCTAQADAHFISSLDDISWLLNSRGGDIAYNPVFLAHVYIDRAQVIVFIDAAKLSATQQQLFATAGIQLKAYTDSSVFLNQIKAQRILLDPAKVSLQHLQSLTATCQPVFDINPTTLFKAQKQPSEIAHVRQAMLKDGIALCQFFAWLEQTLEFKASLSELDIDEKLTAFRAAQPGFLGLSFATIAGFNANGALPHYRATAEDYAMIEGNGLLLIDSGAQYLEGTTDITRVVAVGQVSAEQKRDYTLVLKAHIALAGVSFPEGIAAPLLDAIPRQVLWQQALDYRHGTGHGVGFALNVHEGPQVLSYYAPITAYSGMREGMITSNEPGLYHEGHYGIRIENLVVNQVKETEQQQYGQFLNFETLTLCPIHQASIERDMLTFAEKQWLNEYHEMVRTRLAPHLHGEALDWLIAQTAVIV